MPGWYRRASDLMINGTSVVRLGTLLLVGMLGCGSTRSLSVAAPAAGRAAASPSVRTNETVAIDPDSFRRQAERLMAYVEGFRNLRLVGMDDGPVPDFELQSVDGTEFDSSELIGHRPFVVAFFATWCAACKQKLRSLRNALDEAGDMLVIPVSFDGPGSRDRVERYLGALGIVEPAVSASEYPLMVLSYDPFDTIPLLVIVGQNGGLVDYQLGYELEHEQRLVASLKLAHVIPPLARPARSRDPVSPAP